MPLGKCDPHECDDYKGIQVCSWCGEFDEKQILKELVLTPLAPTAVNEKGGKQSAVIHRCDLLPAKALLHLSEILKAGCDKYGKDNWKQIELLDHLNHAMIHIFAYLDGNKQDDHLGHAACRMLMCLEMELS